MTIFMEFMSGSEIKALKDPRLIEVIHDDHRRELQATRFIENTHIYFRRPQQPATGTRVGRWTRAGYLQVQDHEI